MTYLMIIKYLVHLFAGDCVLYRNIPSLQECLILQEDLDSLALWEADLQIKFNVAKYHSMRVTRHYSHKLYTAPANLGKRQVGKTS